MDRSAARTPADPTADARPLDVRWLGQVPYQDALDLQARLVVERRGDSVPDQLLLLEHPHVITMGSSSSEGHVLLGPEELHEKGIQLFETGRGGDVTYHGPGQLVGYPILDLKPDRMDLHRYLRDLEDVLIGTLASLDLRGEREPGLTGVWVGGAKIAAIGVRVSSGWITSHGFALNVSTDLEFFGTVVPCGITDRPVTSLEKELGRAPEPDEVRRAVVRSFADVFERAIITT